MIILQIATVWSIILGLSYPELTMIFKLDRMEGSLYNPRGCFA